MTDRCAHLEYREAANGKQFDHERPFCSVIDEFVQPMRADICAARHDLDPAADCEYYREEHDLGSVTGFDGDVDRAGASGDVDADRAGASGDGDADRTGASDDAEAVEEQNAGADS